MPCRTLFPKNDRQVPGKPPQTICNENCPKLGYGLQLYPSSSILTKTYGLTTNVKPKKCNFWKAHAAEIPKIQSANHIESLKNPSTSEYMG